MAKGIKLVHTGLKSLLVILVGLSKIVTGEEGVPMSVSRRRGGDSFHILNSSEQFLCRDDNDLTYLVHERRCVKNQELFNGNY